MLTMIESLMKSPPYIDYTMQDRKIKAETGQQSPRQRPDGDRRSDDGKPKQKLADTDYKALKYADGVLSREEYEPVRKQRQKWRDRINEIEKDFTEPTITREEMDRAEERAMKNVRCREV